VLCSPAASQVRWSQPASDSSKGLLPGRVFGFLELVTTGDQRTDWSLQERGGKGLFTKELEDALLEGRAFAAVHSAKDLPTTLPDGLALAGFLPRADARDVLVFRMQAGEALQAGGAGLRVATSSPRRRAQGALLWPGAGWTQIRGNVETRLRKIADGEADATLLAAAGLERLGIRGWPGLVFRHLPVERMVPAAGQAAIAIECRAADLPALAPLLDAPTREAVSIERRLLAAFGGGCQSAVAAHWVNGVLHVFHEVTGYATFTLPALSDADAALSDIVDRLRAPQ